MFYGLKKVDIRILVICYAGDMIEYDSGIIKLYFEKLHNTFDANRTV